MTVVVLGCRQDSIEVRPELQGRMDVGIDALQRTDSETLVVSGGWTNPDVPFAECDAMARYAIENGVDPEDVVLEDRARDTVGNAYFTRLLLDGIDVSTVHVVSSCYHMERAAFLFEQCFGREYYVRTADCYRASDPAPERLEREKLEYAREFFDSVMTGDVAAIRERLVEDHPLYDDSYLEASDLETGSRSASRTER